jgi:hypothetical protein
MTYQRKNSEISETDDKNIYILIDYIAAVPDINQMNPEDFYDKKVHILK